MSQFQYFTPHKGQRLINVDPPHQLATVLRCRKRARTISNLYGIRVRQDDGQEYDSFQSCWLPHDEHQERA